MSSSVSATHRATASMPRWTASWLLVGNQALMRHHGIVVPGDLLAGHPEASEVFVARAGTLMGAIVIADSVRPEARQAIAAIHAMGIKTFLLTGDAKPVADVVTRQLGIAEVAANLVKAGAIIPQ